GLLIGLLISAVLLWVLVSLVGGEAKFATLLSIATYSGVTSILLGIAGVAVLMLKGVGDITSPADLQPALGLDLLVPEAGRFLTAFLKAVNPFTIWAVLPADADLELRAAAPAQPDGQLHQPPHPFLVQHLEGIVLQDAVLHVERQEPPRVVA